jgi:predicted nucleotidyltransferase
VSDWPIPDQVPAAVRSFLEALLASIVETLGASVEGIVLFGSLVAGGFDPETSDLDLLVALAADVDEAALEGLRRMHARLASAHPEWEDRVDVAYLSAAALRTFKKRESALVIISPGEPLHRTTTDPGWVMNWHAAREAGVSLLGSPPRDLIAPTTQADFVSAVRTHVRWMLAKAESSDSPDLQAYAIVTACRALYTRSTGAQASKQAATHWVEGRYPEWSGPIRQALAWRKHAARGRREARAPIPRGLEFVRFVAREV